MSNAASTLGLDQIRARAESSPVDETLRRFADQSPAWLIPRLVATQEMRAMLHDARQRTRDSHRVHMRALGVEDVMDKTAEDADMGDINIKGDTFNIVPEPTQQQPAAQPQTNGGLKKFLIPALLGGALLGGGAGAMALYNYVTDKPDTTVNIPAQDWRLGIQVTDQP